MEAKKTPLYQKHLDAGGKIVDFSGWLMPVEYKSTLKECLATRQSCGLFDASHMGEIKISGNDAFLFLQGLVSNDLSILKKGRLQYNLFLREAGGVIDDCMVYRHDSLFVCVVNASNKEKVYDWLLSKVFGDVVIEDISDKTALLALQGPWAEDILFSLVGGSIRDLAYMSFCQTNGPAGELLISRSGYTGEDGFEIYASNHTAPALWDGLCRLAAGKLTLCGLGARDILRIEAGYPLYGHEIGPEIDPFSASLGWAVKMNKNFTGKEALGRLLCAAGCKKRIGFIMRERAPARQGYAVYSQDKPIGEVSSGAFSPNTGTFIGMALVDKSAVAEVDDIEIAVRNRRCGASVVSLPFIGHRVKTAAAKG